MFDSLSACISAWLTPTKSADEIALEQQRREAEAGDKLADALESLAGKDQKKVSQGMILLNALKAKKPLKESENGNNS